MPTPTVRVSRDVCPDRIDPRYGQEVATDYAVGQGIAEVELSIPDDGSVAWCCVNGDDFPVERLPELARNLCALLEHPDVHAKLRRLAADQHA